MSALSAKGWKLTALVFPLFLNGVIAYAQTGQGAHLPEALWQRDNNTYIVPNSRGDINEAIRSILTDCHDCINVNPINSDDLFQDFLETSVQVDVNPVFDRCVILDSNLIDLSEKLRGEITRILSDNSDEFREFTDKDPIHCIIESLKFRINISLQIMKQVD